MKSAKWIQIRGPDAMLSDRRRDAVGIVEEREDVGAGAKAAQRFKNFFASAHAEEPIMDECYTHGDRRLTRGARFIISICRARRPGADPAVRPTILALTGCFPLRSAVCQSTFHPASFFRWWWWGRVLGW